MLKFQEKQVTRSEINAFEKANNFKLVKNYKSFLAKNNGGVPVENMFYDGNIESGVTLFFRFYIVEIP